MLKKEIATVLDTSKSNGWVLEPDAKSILRSYGIAVPRFTWAANPEEALQFVRERGFPVVAKVVSPKILHKSDVGGVVTGIDNDEWLNDTFQAFSQMEGFAGMLVEEMVSGMELMIGAKMDEQFGPVILFGMGGTEVEIYKDTVLRMAPLKEQDVPYMIKNLKAHRLLEGYRGSKPVNREALTRALLSFSDLVMDIHEFIESIDLNPVLCSPEQCMVADARIMLIGR
ncbi:MAG: acetate--CoA ligase family protein [Desulfatiglandaceae bacterium]|jgi:acetate---CoA ligase (ADP-forming) subunit beta